MVLPGWMASYADMFTVMMVFFILLFAMSQIDVELFERFISSFNPTREVEFSPIQAAGDIFAEDGTGILPEPDPPPPEGTAGDPESPGGRDAQGDTVGDMMNTFRTYMAEAAATAGEWNDSFDVTVGDDYLRINIDEVAGGGVLFPSGQARLTPAAVTAVDYLGPMLLSFSQAGHGIIVEGHTDDRPINTPSFPSNWTLSGARAMSVVERLVIHTGINVHMIAGTGRGEYFPIGDNNTAEGRAQNRRVEIKVFTQEATERGPIGGWFSIPGIQ